LQAIILQIAMTSMAASTKPAEEADFIEDGDPRGHPAHRIQLRSLERHREEEKLHHRSGQRNLQRLSWHIVNNWHRAN
jgi:hypothetical protein